MSEELPTGWCWARIAEVADYVTSGSREWSKFYAAEGVAGALFVRTEDIKANRLDLRRTARVALPKSTEGKRSLLRGSDLLVTITGANVGRCAIVPDGIEEAYVSQSVALVRLAAAELAPLVHLGAQTVFRGHKTELEHMAYGIGRPVLNLENIRALRLPLAPLREARRVVASVESYLSRVDDAVATLERVQRNMKRYRASVLKTAVEGRLVPTEAELARAEGRDYEPACKLLSRILAERRQRWEQSGRKRRYEEPASPDTAKMSALPEGWLWVTVEQIARVASGQTPTDIAGLTKESGEVPWFKVGDMNAPGNETYMHSSREWLRKSECAQLGLHVHPGGTIVFPKRGGAIATNKKRRLSRQSAYDLNTMGLVPAARIGDYLWVWLSGVDLSRLADGSNVPQINHGDIAPLPVPLPPEPEQERIYAEVERLTSEAAAQEMLLTKAVARLARLRQSILKWAFEGRLVDQDPSDEPAAVLLERIRAERAAAAPVTRSRVKRPRAKVTR